MCCSWGCVFFLPFLNRVMFFDRQSRILRTFGFKSDQEGIMSRHLREHGGWNPHLNNTRQAIIDAMQSKPRKMACILGSGWLLDVPIDELSQSFDEVVLVDIFHPRQIVNRVEKLGNVSVQILDLSGVVESVYDALQQKKQITVNDITFTNTLADLCACLNPDFVVSVNLLNQLDILITDYLKEKQAMVPDEIFRFKQLIQKHHITQLPVGKSYLITDFEEQIFLRDGNLERSNPLVFIDLPKNDQTRYWQWNFDSLQTYYDYRTTVFNVMATEM